MQQFVYLAVSMFLNGQRAKSIITMIIMVAMKMVVNKAPNHSGIFDQAWLME
jgi:hypothetical protein